MVEGLFSSRQTGKSGNDDADRTPNAQLQAALLWLARGCIVLFGGYSLGWFWLAGRLGSGKRQMRCAAIMVDGVKADCINPAARLSVPHRPCLRQHLGVFRRRAGRQPVGGKISSASQIYDPMRLVAELDGPVLINSERAPARCALDWDDMRHTRLLDAAAETAVAGKRPTEGGDSRRRLAVRRGKLPDAYAA